MSSVPLPHIKYLTGTLTSSVKTLYYLGGESEENHSRLTVGKEYAIRSALYSETREVKRINVWVCTGDESKLCRIDIKNFGTFVEFRERKINQIIN